MPLDNAQFIAELSVTDPPGTDPLNQGDDHIRTTKLAVQQSFPNVGSAVPQTGVQMAQMAIKNEVNTFTVDQVFNGQQRGGNGSAAAPTWSFVNSPNMGLFRNASAQLAVAFGGVQVATFASTNFDTTLNIRGPGGSAAAPSHSFSGAANNGMYNVDVGVLGFAAGGVQAMRLSTAEAVISTVDFRLTDNNIPATIDSVVTRGSSFTFDEIIGFGKEIFLQNDAIFNDLVDGRPKVKWRTNSIDRWSWGTVGLDGITFALTSFTDAGAFLHNPLQFERATGFATFSHKLFLLGNLGFEDAVGASSGHLIDWRRNGLLRWQLSPGTDAAGYNMAFVRYSDAGGFLGLPIQIDRLTGFIRLELGTTNPGGTNRLWKSSGFVAIT